MGADFAWMIAEEWFVGLWINACLAEKTKTILGADKLRLRFWVFGCWGWEPTIHRRIGWCVWSMVVDTPQYSSPDFYWAQDWIVSPTLGPGFVGYVVFL